MPRGKSSFVTMNLGANGVSNTRSVPDKETDGKALRESFSGEEREGLTPDSVFTVHKEASYKDKYRDEMECYDEMHDILINKGVMSSAIGAIKRGRKKFGEVAGAKLNKIADNAIDRSIDKGRRKLVKDGILDPKTNQPYPSVKKKVLKKRGFIEIRLGGAKKKGYEELPDTIVTKQIEEHDILINKESKDEITTKAGHPIIRVLRVGLQRAKNNPSTFLGVPGAFLTGAAIEAGLHTGEGAYHGARGGGKGHRVTGAKEGVKAAWKTSKHLEPHDYEPPSFKAGKLAAKEERKKNKSIETDIETKGTKKELLKRAARYAADKVGSGIGISAGAMATGAIANEFGLFDAKKHKPVQLRIIDESKKATATRRQAPKVKPKK